MKLAKYIDGSLIFVDCENGTEITRKKKKRTEEDLYAEGYKKACLMEQPDKDAVEQWVEYPTCFVQTWYVPVPEDDIVSEEETDK